MAYLSMPNPEIYRAAIRSGLAIWYSVDASRGGVPIEGAQNMRPVGGSITDTTKPGVRRSLSLELAPATGAPARDLFDALSPVGTLLTVTGHVRLANRVIVDIPMGVFDVDSQKMSEGNGRISLTAPDRWVQLQRARFTRPTPSVVQPGWTVVNQIESMIQSAYGLAEPVLVTATSRAPMNALVWEKDRAKAIADLAKSIGAWVYADRLGVWTLADLPTAGPSADWLVDSSASGVLIELDRERSRTTAYNVVVVESSATDGPAFPTTMVWDNDVTSPTYAGTQPLTDPASAGPFGLVTYYFDTPLPLDVVGALNTGLSILARVTGLASSVSLGMVPNPAIDAMDTIDVLPPGYGKTVVTGSGGVPIVQRVSQGAVMERHVVDTVTHPLTVDGTQHIDGRSTRSEEIDGGS